MNEFRSGVEVVVLPDIPADRIDRGSAGSWCTETKSDDFETLDNGFDNELAPISARQFEEFHKLDPSAFASLLFPD